ncbi:MAG: right-handed parallel beta-helix repeat-containing protein [Verrucomicrobia bacterium]|nr:right-handed parallel beta-helix repeat-containing protein [Verrucomicrobiota bacterium]
MSANAKDFQVKDYGAKGDGETDDGPAIRKAVAAAVAAAPGSKVVFEKRRYRLGRAKVDYHISLNGVKGLTIEGNGAELINNPWNNIVKLEECEDVTVRGFVLDCDPLPFTQGTITDVDAKNGSFLLKIQEGYDNPVEVYRKIGKAKPHWGWGVCMDPEKRIRKADAVMHFHIESVTSVSAMQVATSPVARSRRERGPRHVVPESPLLAREGYRGGGDSLLQVQLLDSARKHAAELAKGDRFVITLKYGGHGACFAVSRSKNCRLEDNTIYTAKYGMTHSLSDNRGRIHVKGVKITFKPGTDRLISTPKDGFHCKHNAVGPIIEDGLYEGMLDDTINISVCPYWVRKDLGGNRYLIAEVAFSPRKGDTLMAYRPKPGTMTMGLVVEEVVPQPTPKGMRGKWNIVTLNKPIPDLGLHTGGNLFPGGHDKLVLTGLYNIDASGKDYIIRGNTFGPQRRHAVLARSSGGLIENNVINGVGGSGVALNNEIGSFYEGPLPSDTVIRNNTFADTFFDSIKIYTNGKGAVAKNITITGNTISGWHTDPRAENSASAINLRNVDGVVIENNTIGESGAKPSISTPVLLQNCTDVINRTH